MPALRPHLFLSRLTQHPLFRPASIASLTSALLIYLKSRRSSSSSSSTTSSSSSSSTTSSSSSSRPSRRRRLVNAEFRARLRVLLRIVVPGLWSKEAFLLLASSSALLARSFLSLYVAGLDGRIVKAIVDRQPKTFTLLMLRWLLVAVPATYTNSMIRYLESKLALAFRTRLSQHAYQAYMRDETYYRVSNVDSRLSNADQCLTDDIQRWSEQLAHLFSSTAKPIVDLVLFVAQLFSLARARSGSGYQVHLPWLIGGGVAVATAALLRRATPPFGRLAAEEQRRYGHLRAVHARLITHSEEVAFYGGHKVEESALWRAYESLARHLNDIYRRRIAYVTLEQFLMKYVWSGAGMVMIAVPTLIRDADKDFELSAVPGEGHESTPSADETPAVESDTVSTRTQDFVTARGLLVSVADALERLLSSWKEVTELAGYTERVHRMLQVFTDVQNGKYVKNASEAGQVVLSREGEVTSNSSIIELEDVPIVTPSGDILVERLSFTIHPGMHLLITGPNGCGKSSLFRMIGGLWRVHGGRMKKPSKGDMFYIPQRPYLCEGTLREQFIYPDTHEDMKAKGLSDEDLMDMLRVVDLEKVVEREGGWDALNDWRDVLSGGEKQRVGMARVFYHRPHWAILDECTSAVSIDVEGRMYNHAKELGITLMTVTHRPSLWRWHNWLLQFDGEGGYTMRELDAQARLTLQEEKTKLEQQLASVPEQQDRLNELCALLGESSIHQTRSNGSIDQYD